MKKPLWKLALAGTALTLACGDGTGPAGAPRFSREITLPEFEDAVAQGPVRLEIELLPGRLVAREIEIKNPAELADEEEIESEITAADGSSLTLALGGLTVGFTPATRFRAEDGDLTADAFLARVQAALAAGEQPPVEARRDPRTAPQDPTDPTFVADELRLDDEADEPEIELNVDGDNLADCSDLAAPVTGCIGVVRVLGLGIAIVQGVTELETEMDDLEGEADFEGLVASVDVAAGSVTLAGGTVVRIVVGTEIEEADDEDELGSLAEVQAALAAGLFVEADGKGVVESLTPLTIVAIEIEFEVEDEPENVPGGIEFEGAVTATDLAARTFTLASGTLVRLTDQTRIESDGDLLTLDAVAQAVRDGRPVRGEGRGLADASGVIEAVVVKWEVDD